MTEQRIGDSLRGNVAHHGLRVLQEHDFVLPRVRFRPSIQEYDGVAGSSVEVLVEDDWEDDSWVLANIGPGLAVRRAFVQWRRCRTWNVHCAEQRRPVTFGALSELRFSRDGYRNILKQLWMPHVLDQWRRILATHSMWQRRSRLRAVYGLRWQLPEGLVLRIWTFLTVFDETEWKIASSSQAWMQEWSPWFELLMHAKYDSPMSSSTCT